MAYVRIDFRFLFLRAGSEAIDDVRSWFDSLILEPPIDPTV
jgi:hypothetical protein